MVLRLSVGLSLVALLVLAGLQYHWIGQIAVSERQRLERGVAEASGDLAEDFVTELRSLTGILEPRFSPIAPDPVSIATRYHYWAAGAAYPNLLKSLYILRSPTDVLRLDRGYEEFVPDGWPPFISQSELSGRGPAFSTSLGDVIIMPLGRRLGLSRGVRGQEPGPPVFRDARDFRDGFAFQDQGESGWVVLELDRDTIVQQVLPRLVARRFPDYEGRDYRVAVVALRGSDRNTVFTSGDSWSDKDLQTADYTLDLLSPLAPPSRRGPPPGGLGAPGGPGGPGAPGGPGGPGAPGGAPGPPSPQRGIRGGGDRPRPDRVAFLGQNWQLLVKHRAGSVETAVMEFRRRNLALSFGVLVVLGVSAVSILISGSRARRLGKLQMEFAAGISHELRTPLAVIQSAAHNLGSGVVQDREGIEEYAAIVKSEARRLTDMLEQVMAYTETQSGRRHYELSPVDAVDVAELAIHNMSTVLQEGNATVENHIEPGLPPVMADAVALTRCLQNLLSNAVKYGRADQASHIEIKAVHIPHPGSAGKVELSVTDHGAGVPERDVKHLFEAFHRGSNARTNTPGNGLGLHLVDRIMRAQNGSVAYERAADGGATFILTLQTAGGPS